jgi:predicted nucleic acid-binding protein
VQLLLPDPSLDVTLHEAVLARGAVLATLGFKPADALHVASAEAAKADVLLTCDDRLCRAARRHRAKLLMSVANPLDWWKEGPHAENAG